MFGQALTDIIRRLNEAQANGLLQQYALIGGFAVLAWGVPRATHDIDFVLALGSSGPTALSRHLGAAFSPASPDDPLREVFTVTLMIEGESIPVRLILLPPAWTPVVFRKVTPLSVLGCLVPVVSWPALLLLKLYAGGPRDHLDAQELLAGRRPSKDELQEIAALAEMVGLSAAFRTVANRPR